MVYRGSAKGKSLGAETLILFAALTGGRWTP